MEERALLNAANHRIPEAFSDIPGGLISAGLIIGVVQKLQFLNKFRLKGLVK
jgi:hypothetical protein